MMKGIAPMKMARSMLTITYRYPSRALSFEGTLFTKWRIRNPHTKSVRPVPANETAHLISLYKEAQPKGRTIVAPSIIRIRAMSLTN